MAFYPYNGPEQFRPLSAWAYFGYGILFSVPLIGLIFLIIYATNDSNINRRNYARSYFCALIFVGILVAIAVGTGGAAALLTYLNI